MKGISWLKYLVYLLLFVLAVWVNGAAVIAVQADYSASGRMNYLLYLIVIMFPIIAGVAIGAEAFVNEWAKAGKWRLNLPKLILLILPSLFISLFYLIAMIPNHAIYDILIAPIYKFFGRSPSFIVLFQMALGYFLITMFYKAETVTEEKQSEGVTEGEAVNMEVESEETDSDVSGIEIAKTDYEKAEVDFVETDTDVAVTKKE